MTHSHACFLTVLEKIIQESKIITKRTIFSKTCQLLAYVDEIGMICTTKDKINVAFLTLEQAARNMGLIINKSKTKYMVMLNSRMSPEEENVAKGYNFQVINEFNYFGSLVTSQNNISCKIRQCILLAQRSYFTFIKHSRSQRLCSKSK